MNVRLSMSFMSSSVDSIQVITSQDKSLFPWYNQAKSSESLMLQREHDLVTTPNGDFFP